MSRTYGKVAALRDVSFTVETGQIHALLGPNGAGKSTLVRVIAGLVDPDEGQVRLFGRDLSQLDRRPARQLVGLVPSGDRSFYLRISGLENLVFFGRLHGLGRSEAILRARSRMQEVGLSPAAKMPVGGYSHGMQKRLSVARALLTAPPILLVDEATHDLDPEAASVVRTLVGDRVAAGAAVVWATQRVDEIRGFADRVTLLDRGQVRFAGSVARFMAVSPTRRYLLHLRPRAGRDGDDMADLSEVVDPYGRLLPQPAGDAEHVALALRDDAVLGDVVTALTLAGVEVASCREERSGVEEAFLRLTGNGGS